MKSLIGFAAFALVGCSAPTMPLTVAVKAPPGAYTGGKCSIRVEGLSFPSTMMVRGGPEEAFVSTLTPEQVMSYQADKVASADKFLESVRVNIDSYVGDKGTVVVGPAGDASYVVRTAVTGWDPSGVMDATFDVSNASDNQHVAAFAMHASTYGWGSGLKMRNGAIQAGWTLLSYFRDRFGCRGPAKIQD